MIDPGTLGEWGEMTRHPVAENPDDWKDRPDDTAEDRELNEKIHREFTEVWDAVTDDPDRQLTWPELHELSARPKGWPSIAVSRSRCQGCGYGWPLIIRWGD